MNAPCAGTRGIEIGVDDDGFIFLGYDADMDNEAEFIWRKNYTEPIDSSRAHEGTKTNGYSCSHAACTPAFTLIRRKPSGMLSLPVLM